MHICVPFLYPDLLYRLRPSQILLTLIQNFGGGPAGLDTLAAAIGEDSGTIVVDDNKEEPTISVQKTEEVPTKKCKANRVKMRVDHTCFIGGEWYYLKAGVCYNVDDNVKSILDGAGLLAPL